jgi:hypothetical protein
MVEEEVPKQEKVVRLVPLSLRKNNVLLKQFKRCEKFAIYTVQQDENSPVRSYEVHVLKVGLVPEQWKKRKTYKGEQTHIECLVSNEGFGKSAWTFNNLKDALGKYNSLGGI